MLICILGIVISIIILAALVLWLYIKHQGDAEVLVEVDKRTEAVKVSQTEQRLDFEVELPYRNVGTQEATILDMYMRIYLPQEQFADVLLRGKVNLSEARRADDYFEAVLLPAGTGKNLLLRFEAYAAEGMNIQDAMREIPDVDVALYADCRGRGALFTVKRYLTLSAAELRKLVN